jgi:hypothetical protein
LTKIAVLVFFGLVLSLTAHAKAACDGTDKLGVVLTSATAIAKMPSDTPAQVRERERVLGNTSALLNKAQHDIDFCLKLGTLTGTDTSDIIGQQAIWQAEVLLGVLAAPDFFAVSSFVVDPTCKKYARDLGSYILSSVSSDNRTVPSQGAGAIVQGEGELIVAFARRGAVDERLINSNEANDALRASLELQGTNISPNCVSEINSFITSLDWAHFGGL